MPYEITTSYPFVPLASSPTWEDATVTAEDVSWDHDGTVYLWTASEAGCPLPRLLAIARHGTLEFVGD